MNRRHRILLYTLIAILPLLLCSCYGPCGPIWSSTAPAKSSLAAKLTPDQFTPAELAYRAALPGGRLSEATTNFVYCLHFADNDHGLPDDFIARFADCPATVIADTKRIVVAQGRLYQPAPGKDYVIEPGRRYDTATDRDAVEIYLNWERINDTRAKARLDFASRTDDIIEIITLAKQHGQWTITDVNEESREHY